MSPLAGLQKYTSLGKHGLEDRLRRSSRNMMGPSAATPSLQRTDSFSSEEGDDIDFDDDGFREIEREIDWDYFFVHFVTSHISPFSVYL